MIKHYGPAVRSTLCGFAEKDAESRFYEFMVERKRTTALLWCKFWVFGSFVLLARVVLARELGTLSPAFMGLPFLVLQYAIEKKDYRRVDLMSLLVYLPRLTTLLVLAFLGSPPELQSPMYPALRWVFTSIEGPTTSSCVPLRFRKLVPVHVILTGMLYHMWAPRNFQLAVFVWFALSAVAFPLVFEARLREEFMVKHQQEQKEQEGGDGKARMLVSGSATSGVSECIEEQDTMKGGTLSQRACDRLGETGCFTEGNVVSQPLPSWGYCPLSSFENFNDLMDDCAADDLAPSHPSCASAAAIEAICASAQQALVRAGVKIPSCYEQPAMAAMAAIQESLKATKPVHVHVILPWAKLPTVTADVHASIRGNLRNRCPDLFVSNSMIREGSLILSLDVVASDASQAMEQLMALQVQDLYSVFHLPPPAHEQGMEVQISSMHRRFKWDAGAEAWELHCATEVSSSGFSMSTLSVAQLSGQQEHTTVVVDVACPSGHRLSAHAEAEKVPYATLLRAVCQGQEVECAMQLKSSAGGREVWELSMDVPPSASSSHLPSVIRVEAWRDHQVLITLEVAVLPATLSGLEAEVLSGCGEEVSEEGTQPMDFARIVHWLETSSSAASTSSALHHLQPHLRAEGKQLLLAAVLKGWQGCCDVIPDTLMLRLGCSFEELLLGARTMVCDDGMLGMAVLSGKLPMVHHLSALAAHHGLALPWSFVNSAGATPMHLLALADASGAMARELIASDPAAEETWHHDASGLGASPKQLFHYLHQQTSPQQLLHYFHQRQAAGKEHSRPSSMTCSIPASYMDSTIPDSAALPPTSLGASVDAYISGAAGDASAAMPTKVSVHAGAAAATAMPAKVSVHAAAATPNRVCACEGVEEGPSAGPISPRPSPRTAVAKESQASSILTALSVMLSPPPGFVLYKVKEQRGLLTGNLRVRVISNVAVALRSLMTLGPMASLMVIFLNLPMLATWKALSTGAWEKVEPLMVVWMSCRACVWLTAAWTGSANFGFVIAACLDLVESAFAEQVSLPYALPLHAVNFVSTAKLFFDHFTPTSWITATVASLMLHATTISIRLVSEMEMRKALGKIKLKVM